jgi:hypothetical protein
MGAVQESTQLTWAWAQQRIWSLTASRLKRRIDQARLAALALGIATAVLAVAAQPGEPGQGVRRAVLPA